MENVLFKIKDNSQMFQANTAAIILCLKDRTCDVESFRSRFLRELPQSLMSREFIAEERVNCACRCRKILDNYFKDDDKKRELCIKYLERLILAKYSGRSQSYLSKFVENLGAIDLTLERLAYAIKNNKPIYFLYCFGGYKSHNCYTFPEVDWAEFFQLKFFIEYLLPIIKDYKYGCIIEYESEDIIIERNNVPREALDKYAESFVRLTEYVKTLVKVQLGIELDIKLIRCRDQYDVNDLFSRMEEKKPEIIADYYSRSIDEQIKWLKRAETNYMWKGGVKEYLSLTEEEKRQIIFDARIDNECFLAADYDLRGKIFFDRPNCIPFVGTWGYSPSASIVDLWFHIKSTYSSSVDFWIGMGVLSYDNDTYKERIVSPPQYKTIESKLSEISISESHLLKVSKNFSTIKVYNGRFPY